jgi:hypothetical protein
MWMVPPPTGGSRSAGDGRRQGDYWPFKEAAFLRVLGRFGADALIIRGGETDVCVLTAIMTAVDAGYRVILAEDALCSVSDESHDAMLRQFGARFQPADRGRHDRGNPRQVPPDHMCLRERSKGVCGTIRLQSCGHALPGRAGTSEA